MKYVSFLKKTLLVSFFALPSISLQLSGMNNAPVSTTWSEYAKIGIGHITSGVKSFARKVAENPLSTGFIGLAVLGLATFHPATAKHVNNGFNHITSGMKVLAENCGLFVRKNPLPTGLIGVAGVGLSLIHFPALRNFLVHCGRTIGDVAKALEKSPVCLRCGHSKCCHHH